MDAGQLGDDGGGLAARAEVKQRHLAQGLGQIDGAFEQRGPVGFAHVLGADAQADAHPFVARAGGDRHKRGAAAVKLHGGGGAYARHAAGQQVHGRAADELCHEFVDGPFVKLQRRADLGDAAARQHDDAVGKRHRLGLVVGDVDHRAVGHRGLELGDLDPGGHAQRGVQVRQGLVEQINLGVAHDGPADGDALALPARQGLGQAVQIGGQLQHPARAVGGLLHLGARLARDLQRKGHVVAHRHVRIQRIGLEHHGDAPLGGRDVVHPLPVDLQRAGADPLQPGDHAQKGGFPAARGADEDDELARPDVEVDVPQDMHVAIGLGDISQCQIGHRRPPL